MRKDASSLRDWELSSTDIGTMGHAKCAYWDVNRACERWLAKRGMGVAYRHAFSRRQHPEPVKEPVVEVKAPVFVPKFKVPRDIKLRVRSKYGTEEERKQARSELIKAQWANMSPEARAERIRKSNSSRKLDIPRNQRANYKEYKRNWEKKKREAIKFNEEELEKRRKRGRALYEKKKNDPQFKAAEKAKKQRYRERLKAKKAASV